jgi:hypothetical protein
MPLHHEMAVEQNPNTSSTMPKRTKSILKTPSTFNEKSIHFDDRIGVIPIGRTNEEDENIRKANILQSSSIVINEPSPPKSSNNTLNAELMAPYSPVSNRSHIIKTYSYYSSSTQLDHHTPPDERDNANNQKPVSSNFTNEIESIKKMLLEPKLNVLPRDKSDRNSISPAAVFLKPQQHAYNQHRSRTERIFIKSPTPMREINMPGENDEEQLLDENNANYLRVPSFEYKHSSEKGNSPANRNNRLRFINKKKVAALRSQSVDLAKIMGNFEVATQPQIPPQYIPLPMKTSAEAMRPHLKSGFVRAKAESPSPRPSLTRQDALSKSIGNDLNSIEMALKSRLAAVNVPLSNSAASNQQHPQRGESSKHLSSGGQSHKHKHRHHHHRNKHHRNGGGGGSRRQHHRSSHSNIANKGGATSSSSSLYSTSNDEKNGGPSNNSSLTSSYSSQDLITNDLNAVDSNDSNSQYRRSSVGDEGSTRNNRNNANSSRLVKRTLYYSSDDSVCGIPKPSINTKRSPK